MKRMYLLLLVLAIVTALSSGWYIGRTFVISATPAQAQNNQLEGVDNPTLESRMGLAFTPVDPTDVGVPISEDEAITQAKASKPRLEEATGIHAELGYLGPAPEDKAIIEGVLEETRLVWFVSFEGITSYASGEPGVETQALRVANEYNVIIDASTGERLFSLIYR